MRTLGVFVLVVFSASVTGACVTVAPGTTTAPPIASLPAATAEATPPAPTPEATASPIAPPTATAPPMTTLPPTLPPVTAPPPATPSPAVQITLPPATPEPTMPSGPSPTPYEGMLGTTTLVFADAFDDPASGWGTGEIENVSISYEGGLEGSRLELAITAPDLFARTTRDLPQAVETLRFMAVYRVHEGSEGFYGAHCQDAEDELLGAGVTTDGYYKVYRRVAGAFEDDLWVSTTTIPNTAAPALVFIEVECGIDDAGNAEIWLAVNGELLTHYSETESALGPLTTVGLHTRAAGEQFAAAVTNTWAWTADAVAGGPTPAPGGVLPHVPAGFDCDPASESDNPGYVDGLACNATGPEGSFISAFYFLYEDEASMDAGFEWYVNEAADWADEVVDGGDCTDGQAGSGTYRIGGETAGRYVCFTHFDAPLLAWTRPELNIFVEAVNTEGDFAELWEWWETAGPNL